MKVGISCLKPVTRRNSKHGKSSEWRYALIRTAPVAVTSPPSRTCDRGDVLDLRARNRTTCIVDSLPAAADARRSAPTREIRICGVCLDSCIVRMRCALPNWTLWLHPQPRNGHEHSPRNRPRATTTRLAARLQCLDATAPALIDRRWPADAASAERHLHRKLRRYRPAMRRCKKAPGPPAATVDVDDDDDHGSTFNATSSR